jgi:hypothetical protein
MSLVYLLGTNHWDLKGPERLRKFLGFVRPTAIGLEASEELIKQGLSDRQYIKAELEKQKQFDKMMDGLYASRGKEAPKDKGQMVFDFLATQGYEMWASYEHQQEDNPMVQIYPVHVHEVLARRSAEVYRKGLGEENIDSQGGFTQNFLGEVNKMNPAQLQEWVDSNYFDLDQIAEVYKDPEHLAFVRECDDVMEPRIRSVVSQNNGGGATVIVAGNNHFFAGYGNNLYERLSDLSPARVRLPEVDKF